MVPYLAPLQSQTNNKPQNELYATSNATTATATATPVRSDSDVAGENHTKDTTQQHQQQPPKSQSIRSTTEKLKWKFLGW